MRLEYPPKGHAFQFGGLTIEPEIEVVELEVPNAHGLTPVEGDGNRPHPRHGVVSAEDGFASGQTYAVCSNAREAIHSKMAIIVPTKDEPVDTLKVVLGGIPHSCLIILVSNSKRDAYKEEVETLRSFCRKAGNRPAIAIHQKDPGAAEAFRVVGMTEPLNTDEGGDGLIRNGKGEGMLLGLAVAAIYCPERRYVGFVDSDSTIAGSVQEYCNAYASGFAMYKEEENNLMVRIRWGSKPKAVEGRIVYSSEGRSSTVINGWLNRLLRVLPGGANANTAMNNKGQGGIMVTGNAGEHAMTMDLALKLRLAGGYAIEPFHFIDLLEQAAEDMRRPHATATRANGINGAKWNGNGMNGSRTNGVNGANGYGAANNGTNGTKYSHHPGRFSAKVVQIKTQNPHLHRSTTDDHIRGMWLQGLGTIYHRLQGMKIYPRATGGYADWDVVLREEMTQYVERERVPLPPVPSIYKSLGSLDLTKLHKVMSQSRKTLMVLGPYRLGSPRAYN